MVKPVVNSYWAGWTCACGKCCSGSASGSAVAAGSVSLAGASCFSSPFSVAGWTASVAAGATGVAASCAKAESGLTKTCRTISKTIRRLCSLRLFNLSLLSPKSHPPSRRYLLKGRQCFFRMFLWHLVPSIFYQTEIHLYRGNCDIFRIIRILLTMSRHVFFFMTC